VSSRTPTGAVQAVVEIAAPPDVVFHALADPEELAAWLGGDAGGDGRGPAVPDGPPPLAAAGRSWRAPALGPDGAPGSVCGEYLVVDPPRRLESTWRASWDDFAPDRVRFELTPIEVGGAPGTRLTLTHLRGTAGWQVTAQAAASPNGWPSAWAGARASARPGVQSAAHGRDEWVLMWDLMLLARLDAHLTVGPALARVGAPRAPRGAAPECWSGPLPRVPAAPHHGE
jgi:uncharacterized protein YndB with AHSA1/START domain